MKNKTINIIIVVSTCALMFALVVLGYVCFVRVFSERPIRTTQAFCSQQTKNNIVLYLYTELIDMDKQTMSKSDMITSVEKQLALKHYRYTEKDFKNIKGGECDLYKRIITINSRLDQHAYAKSFVHEALHLKLLLVNEPFVCYNTFKFLYENENAFLRETGLLYAINVLCGQYEGEYDITNQIIYYFLIEKGETYV